ncbi:helix-turn-helix transcriptional regulator [Aquipseudomonas alcaligenes]|uniref:helix-turn-helix transcriptional regulator n=1 Tax=Aquipseudomonas alcaligenes TaxID=43263 RepID=UPI0009DBA08D
MPLEKLLTINDLAEILGRSAGTIKNQHSKTPFKLPPVCRIPGAGRLLWRREDVDRWLQQHVAPHDIPVSTLKRKPGRPRKSLAVVSGGGLRHA